MLRYEHRWHDAANGPLLGEARLLCFTRARGTGSLPNPDDEEEGDETANNAIDPNAAPEAARQTQAIDAGREFTHRNAKEIIHANDEEAQKSATVLDRARGLQEQLQSLDEAVTSSLETARARKNVGKSIGKASIGMMEGYQASISEMSRNVGKRVGALELFDAKEWEDGNMAPSEFLVHYRAYLNNLNEIDAMDPDMNTTQREKESAAREDLYRITEEAVNESRRTQPRDMPPDLVRASPGHANVTDKELWALYTKNEKDGIIHTISDAAGLTPLKLAMTDDIDTIAKAMDKIKLKEKILDQQRKVLDAAGKDNQEKDEQNISSAGNDESSLDPLFILRSAYQTLNMDDWMTIREMMAACTEVIESIKEVRKRKSMGRVTRAALMLGRVASLFPGSGGKELVNGLEEQQHKKQEEVKDNYKKELSDSRKDYGFTDLFGGGGKQGILKEAILSHDSNLARAVIEHAAGKGLLYDIDNGEWDKYVIPGGVRFVDAMPPEWNTTQISTYFENMQFANRQGTTAAEEAGGKLVKGRTTFDGFTIPFKASVKGMSLPFAKGIANEALKKVKNGHMSTMLTLIVLNEWKTNALFRQYAPADWYDRLSGDHKQLLIGMIKYDARHLIAGARGRPDIENGDLLITDKLEKADFEHLNDDPEKRNKQRLGPLVVAVEKYVIRKDPSLGKPGKEAKLMEIVAKVIACQTVTLDNEQKATIYAPELAPYQIVYDPNEMRGANVKDIGDDFFIERSEITHGTVEVMKAIGAVGNDGFNYEEKARYYFSHIATNYQELLDAAAEFERKGKANEAREMRGAALQFFRHINPQLNAWVAGALVGSGGEKLVTVYHARETNQYLLLMLMKKGLISANVIDQLRQQGKPAAKILMKQYEASIGTSRRNAA